MATCRLGLNRYVPGLQQLLVGLTTLYHAVPNPGGKISIIHIYHFLQKSCQKSPDRQQLHWSKTQTSKITHASGLYRRRVVGLYVILREIRYSLLPAPRAVLCWIGCLHPLVDPSAKSTPQSLN